VSFEKKCSKRIIAGKKAMPKQKYFTHHISVRLMDHEFKRINQVCLRKKTRRAVLVREILQSAIEAMLTKKPVTDES
jgi:hypothetical protein